MECWSRDSKLGDNEAVNSGVEVSQEFLGGLGFREKEERVIRRVKSEELRARLGVEELRVICSFS